MRSRGVEINHFVFRGTEHIFTPLKMSSQYPYLFFSTDWSVFQADIHNHVVMSAERSLPDVLPRQVSFLVLGLDFIYQQREERLRKTFFVFLCGLTFP